MDLRDWVSLTGLILGIFNLVSGTWYQRKRLEFERMKLRLMLDDEECLKHDKTDSSK